MDSLPPPSRYAHKTTVLVITVLVAVVLVALMIARYSGRNRPLSSNESGSRISKFYTTIVSSTQSYFGTKK